MGMITAVLSRVRELISRNYHSRIRLNGEAAMENLMGTMIGVLFLSVISASFAGIFMAYSVSSAKATENTNRMNLISKYSTDTLNNLYVESVSGSTAAQNAGWTVKAARQALSSVTPSINPSSSYSSYTYAATRSMVSGGTTTISQWGQNVNGLVTLYTAVPKAGSPDQTCDWTQPDDKLQYYCNVVIDTVQSVVSPPVGVNNDNAVNWASQITQFPWNNSANNWASATKYPVTTSKLGDINVNNQGTLKYVVMFDNLQPNVPLSIDFVANGQTINTQTITPTLNPGETGTVTRSVAGTFTTPANNADVAVYLDTDVNTPTASDPTVTIYRFIIYTKN